ncbi:uncharacterized protein LOC116305659, partial [Actinia tenebrosa]|uniref:Uncharacterized protein LOC116305659 n=1 Tax=Actinia tenebrosa TaxID=6105 RepID=A0A6P8IVY5_ACTTE
MRFLRSLVFHSSSPPGRFFSTAGCLYSQVNKALRVQIEKMESGKGVEIEWQSGEKSRFHSSWLRMNCQCSKCSQGHSGQRKLNVAKLPENISLAHVDISESSFVLKVSWKNEEEHTSVFPLDWLKQHSYSRQDIERQSVQRKFQAFQGKDIPSVNYHDIVNTDSGLLEWLLQVNHHGISVVKKVPSEEDSILKVARKMGPVLRTIYGEVFDVISTPKPINIAYSSSYLPLHMDLAYYQSPPGIQLLHCFRFDPQVAGGESIFLDVFAVAESFRETHPEEFNTLVRVPATFQKIHFERDYPVYLKYQRPHISLNHRKEIVAITWSPPFEGPLFVDEDDVEAYYNAYRKFNDAIEKSPLLLKFKLNEGELVAFNNIRVLHGRR